MTEPEKNDEEPLLKPEIKIQYDPGAMDAVPEADRDAVKKALHHMFSCKQEVCSIGTCVQVILDDDGHFVPTGTPEDLTMPPKGKKLLVVGTKGLRVALEKANELGLAGWKMESLSHGIDGQSDLVFFIKKP
jgi:hypothetical protein